MPPRVAALLLAGTVLCSPAAAQDRTRVWLGVGIGGGGGHDAGGPALMAQIVLQKRAHHFAARSVLMFDPYDSDVIGEVGVLYGRSAKRPWGHASIAGGLAYTSVEPCPETTCTTVGVPIVAEAALRWNSVVGLGAQTFANLNSKSVYGGLVVFLQLGWMP